MTLTLEQKIEQVNAKRDAAVKFYENDGKGTVAFTKEQIEDGLKMNKELADLQDEVSKQSKMEEEAKGIKSLQELTQRENINRGGFSSEEKGFKTVGRRVIESSAYKSYNPLTSERRDFKIDEASVSEYLKGAYNKTAMTTAAGFANPNDRSNIVVPYALPSIVVQDLIPAIDADVDTFKFMEKTTATNNAAGTAENIALGENAYVWTERSVTIETIGAFIPVTEQQLQVPTLAESVINDDLAYDLKLKEQSYLLTGSGSTPIIRGLENVSSIQTYTKGTGGTGESTPDAVLQLLKAIRFTGFANPNATVWHPTDWITIRLLRNGVGDYIWGSPADQGNDRIWGLPVVQTTHKTQGTVLAADFNYTLIVRRQGVLIEWGWNSDDFTKYKKTVRATERMCLAAKRAGAIGLLTL